MKEQEGKLKPLEAIGISGVISQVGWLTVLLQGGLDIAYNRAFQNLTQNEINSIVLASSVIGTTLGIIAQKGALERTAISTDPVATGVYSIFKRFEPACFASIIYGIISNPVTLYSLRSVIFERHASNEVWVNMAAASTIGLFYTGLNFLIAQGREEDAVKAVNWVASHTVKPLDHLVMDKLHGREVTEKVKNITQPITEGIITVQNKLISGIVI